MLSTYANEVLGCAEELADMLSENEIDAIRAIIDKSGVDAWHTWRKYRAAEIAAYVKATPAQRERSKKLNAHYPLIVLGAYQHCLRASAMLYIIDQFQPGGSYRAMAAKAGTAFSQIEHQTLDIDPSIDLDWDWPWDAPDPFYDAIVAQLDQADT